MRRSVPRGHCVEGGAQHAVPAIKSSSISWFSAAPHRLVSESCCLQAQPDPGRSPLRPLCRLRCSALQTAAGRSGEPLTDFATVPARSRRGPLLPPPPAALLPSRALQPLRARPAPPARTRGPAPTPPRDSPVLGRFTCAGALGRASALAVPPARRSLLSAGLGRRLAGQFSLRCRRAATCTPGGRGLGDGPGPGTGRASKVWRRNSCLWRGGNERRPSGDAEPQGWAEGERRKGEKREGRKRSGPKSSKSQLTKIK